MQNSAAGWFGSPSLGQGFMGQNYGNRRRYGGNPYPVSQESVLPPRSLTEDQLEDWEAEHEMKAPPGSHPLRPHPDFPSTTQETPPDVMPWVDPGLPSVTPNPIPTTPITPPAPIAPVTTVTPTPALPEMVEGPPVETPGPVSEVADEDLMDTYLEQVEGLRSVGEEYTRDDAKDSVRRPNINRAIESVLSSVPSYDRQRVKDLAKETYSEFGELDWALYFYGEEGPGAMADRMWTPTRGEPGKTITTPIATPGTLPTSQLTPTLGPTPLIREDVPSVDKDWAQDTGRGVVDTSQARASVPTPGGGGQNCPPGQFWDGTQCRGSVSSIPDVASLPASGGSPVASIPTGGGGGVPDVMPPAAMPPMGPVDVSNLPSVITGIRNPMTARVGEAYPVVNRL